MKFLKKLFSTVLFLLFIIIAGLTIFWFAGGQQTLQQFYRNNIQSITGIALSNSADDPRNDTILEHSKRHADPNYVCPMHPQIIKGEPGNCPICGMDLVKKEVVKQEADDPKNDTPLDHSKRHADPNYICPMHPQIVKGEPGNCPICGMDLVKKEAPKTRKIKKVEKKIKYWVAPMDANYRRDKPGKSLMGMDLVPVYETGEEDQETDDGLPIITINATTAQNMGVRIANAKMQTLSRTINTIGSITYNEDTLHHVHVRAKGWVEKLYTRSLGDPVSKGKTLLEFYSPEILSAQKDLIIAKRNRAIFSSSGSKASRRTSLEEASKTRLRDLSVPESVINKIVKSGKSQNRIPIIAKHNGVVVKTGIRDGMYITPSTEIYTIADLSSVWLIVDVFEHQLSWVKVGDKAEIQVQGVPGKTWIGKVEYIYPELSPNTRTLRVRLKIATPKQQLKPNMFADVSLFTSSKKALTVPAEAVIYYEKSPRLVKVITTGKTKKYQPIEVKIGMKSNGNIEILAGIKEGDKILVSGQFMIDSESNLQASFRRLSGDGAISTKSSSTQSSEAD